MSSYPSTGSENRHARDSRSNDPQTLGTSGLHTKSSAVSWSAIFAGATAATALSLVLLILGTGLGLSAVSAVSAWTPNGISAAGFGISSIIWITFTQLEASSMGGYLAGRLRTQWVNVRIDEVYFHDTAHGFLTWAIASLSTATLLSSVTGTIVGNSVQLGATVAGSASIGAATMAAASTSSGVAAAGPSATGLSGYFIDSLFRKDTATSASVEPAPAAPMADADAAASAAETGRIFANSIRAGALPPEDVRYVGQLVAKRTGLAQADAEKRVADGFVRMQTKLRETETAARMRS